LVKSESSVIAEKPYGTTARERTATLADIEEPFASPARAAPRKLSRSGLVDAWTGSWVIEDPAFAERVRASGRYRLRFDREAPRFKNRKRPSRHLSA